jgi:hypothetical protein
MRMVRNSRLCGQAIIAYLQQKGFPEVRTDRPVVRDMMTLLELQVWAADFGLTVQPL